MENYQENYFEVEEELPDHHFRTEIPNILFDIGLDPSVLATYCHLKRVAGDRGKSWKSNKQIAKAIGISERKLIDVLKILENYNVTLKTPLIRIKRRIRSDSSQDTNIITIVNIWGINGKINRDKKLERNHNKEGGGGANPAPGGANPAPGGAQFADQEEEPYQEEPSKEKPNLELSLPQPSQLKPVESESESLENSDFILKDKEGKALKVSISEVFRRFCSTDFSTEEIKLAISIARKNREVPVGDPYSYLVGIMTNLRKKASLKSDSNKQCSENAQKPIDLPVKCDKPGISIPKELWGL